MGDDPLGDLPAVARTILATAAISGELGHPALARITGSHLDGIEAAFAMARARGLTGPDGALTAEAASALVELLSDAERASQHAAVARHLLTAGPDRVVEALAHARAARGAVPLDELVEMAERGGRLCLTVGDAASAVELLQMAVDLDGTRDDVGFAGRLCDLADARQALGEVDRARDLYAWAFAIGERAEDAPLMVRAAVAHALPVEWFHGDDRSASLLARVSDGALSSEQQMAVQAARAMVEMRVPLLTGGDQQVAWITRPTVARAFADDALAHVDAGVGDAWTQGFVLTAWRACHRSPALLDRRRELSERALDLAQTARRPALLVEAANWSAVDALESGDRPRYEEAVSIARWVAERDGAPWLRWQALLMAAGAAMLDADIDRAEQYRLEAADLALAMQSPRWLSADRTIFVQAVLERDDPAEMRPHLIDDDSDLLAHPMAAAWMASLRVRLGHEASAERLVRQALDRLDEEASYLHVATRCAAVACQLGADELIRTCLEILRPWNAHVSVESLAWSCDGPVALWSAALHHRLGETASALALLDLGEATALAIEDVRATRRAAELRRALGDAARARPAAVDLTARELDVLRLLASGATNPEIARRLSFSLGTIRADTSSIYRKLGVQGRAAAVACAIELGLIVSAS